MDQNDGNKSKKTYLVWILSIGILFLLTLWIVNATIIGNLFSRLLSSFRALIIGLAGAYILLPVCRFFEKKVFFKVKSAKVIRILSVICSLLFAILILYFLVVMILPQLMDSVVSLVKNHVDYVNSFTEMMNGIISKLNQTSLFEENPIASLKSDVVLSYFYRLFPDVDFTSFATTIAEKRGIIGSAITGMVGLLFDIGIGIFIALLFLYAREKISIFLQKLTEKLLGSNVLKGIKYILRTTDRSFGGFLQGKIVDSLIIGILTFIVISIFKVPYAPLVATFVGVTNIIPFVGPFIGAIPTAFIILLADSSKVIPFLLIILLVQQLDGNVIGPAILGNNTGVSSLCVMVAITVFGNLFGLVGMLLGVPVFATIFSLLDDRIEHRLIKKGLPTKLENYYSHSSTVNPSADSGSSNRLFGYLKNVELKRQSFENSNRPFIPTKTEKIMLIFYRVLRKFNRIEEPTQQDRCAFLKQKTIARLANDNKEAHHE